MKTINAKCQVFTPKAIVNEVLDKVEYTQNLYGKKVLENSCGDGSFLIEIVERYIKDCLKQGYTREKITKGLETDIIGAEIDIKHRKQCIQNLNLVLEKYKIDTVNWNIMRVDILRKEVKDKFQFIIGNPPYITYSELDVATRTYIKENYSVCMEGKPDYYYAFIEKSIRCLDTDGRLAYLIPNNIFKNRFAQRLREYILPSLISVYDYTAAKLFTNKLTSSAIIICHMNSEKDSVLYTNMLHESECHINKNLLGDKWVFAEGEIHENKDGSKIKSFGDDFKAICSIATLLNKVYIFKEFDEDSNYLYFKEFKIEKEVLREAISPRALQHGKKEYIIFPYYYNEEGMLKRYLEDEFIKKYPGATQYLESHIEQLNKRDKDQNASWFEYGRSQTLRHINQEKLLLSTLVTGRVKVHELSRDQVPYSGICIIPKGEKGLDEAKKILNSLEFLAYVERIGINANGKSMRITAKDIENYKYR